MVAGSARDLSRDPESRVRDVVGTVVRAAGFDLEELTVVPAGRRRLLRVVIDSDTGVDLDAAAQISRTLSEQLDTDSDTDPMGALPYTLEVTSPGIGRALTLPRHFRRARGRLLAITTADGQTVTGRVRQATQDRVELLTGRDGLAPRWLELAGIARAKVEVEFSTPSAAVLAALGEAAAPLTADAAGWDADGESDDDPQDDAENAEEEGEPS